ncbi:hypothetical protein PV10_08643 [Exophiala mesophila]|uniref:Uncharacterized protein n=1 Tax=Exophiala mesophila TaxID=212818 RepID=A0A0D1WJK2_EXOME|nr:uncharacterized protein PV10_08643 [Exophiala mesophila]KIV89025.1 hypothetical protein PV10_08643 [Exophiala mesophila]
MLQAQYVLAVERWVCSDGYLNDHSNGFTVGSKHQSRLAGPCERTIVQHRTINNCSERQTTSKICVFSDDSERCIECQNAPGRRCTDPVEDEDTDRFQAALDSVKSQIDEILSHNLPNSDLYRSLKARLEQESNATAAYTVHLGSTPQDQTQYVARVAHTNSTNEEVQNFHQSLIDDKAYQELLVRRRMMEACLGELLSRRLFYFDELEALMGHPERRGLKRVE